MATKASRAKATGRLISCWGCEIVRSPAGACQSRPAKQNTAINVPPKNPQLIGALLLTVLLTACSPNVPTAKRGSVETYREGRMVSSRALAETEARAVTAWFKSNGTGWSSGGGAEPPAVMIRVQHSNRETTLINLSGTTVVVTNSSGQFRKTLTPAAAADLGALAAPQP